MLAIRLSRRGAKKRPFYHVVATDKRSRRDGRYVEKIGYFNPVARGQDKRFVINMERYEHWLSVGAQSSNRVLSLIKEFKFEQQHGKSLKDIRVEKKQARTTRIKEAEKAKAAAEAAEQEAEQTEEQESAE